MRKISTLFRGAARLLEEKEAEIIENNNHHFGACEALYRTNLNGPHSVVKREARHREYTVATRYFDSLFRPKHEVDVVAGFYFSYPEGKFHSREVPITEAVSSRILALNLAAEIAESEGL